MNVKHVVALMIVLISALLISGCSRESQSQNPPVTSGEDTGKMESIEAANKELEDHIKSLESEVASLIKIKNDQDKILLDKEKTLADFTEILNTMEDQIKAGKNESLTVKSTKYEALQKKNNGLKLDDSQFTYRDIKTVFSETMAYKTAISMGGLYEYSYYTQEMIQDEKLKEKSWNTIKIGEVFVTKEIYKARLSKLFSSNVVEEMINNIEVYDGENHDSLALAMFYGDYLIVKTTDVDFNMFNKSLYDEALIKNVYEMGDKTYMVLLEVPVERVNMDSGKAEINYTFDQISIEFIIEGEALLTNTGINEIEYLD